MSADVGIGGLFSAPMSLAEGVDEVDELADTSPQSSNSAWGSPLLLEGFLLVSLDDMLPRADPMENAIPLRVHRNDGKPRGIRHGAVGCDLQQLRATNLLCCMTALSGRFVLARWLAGKEMGCTVIMGQNTVK